MLALSFPAALLPAEPSYAARLDRGLRVVPAGDHVLAAGQAGHEDARALAGRTYGGGFGPISRACGGSTSEHTEGRAFDWTLDAATHRGQRLASRFLDDLRATDRRGNTDALARRMGVMYVIWDDHMYSAWGGFDREPYLTRAAAAREVLEDAAAPRPPARLAHPPGRPRRDQLVPRRAAASR